MGKISGLSFEKLIGWKGLTTGDGFCLANLEGTGKDEFSQLFPLPNVDDSSYAFKLTPFLLGMLQSFSGEHTFQVTAVDALDNERSVTLKITVTKEE